MEQDLSDIFHSYCTILEQCKVPFLNNDGLNLCKRLQTKIGISLTLMKQIDFGDIIIQTFMGDLDFFSTAVENFSNLLTNNEKCSKEEYQDIRSSLVQSIVKLIPSTKEFYLQRVEYKEEEELRPSKNPSRVFKLEIDDQEKGNNHLAESRNDEIGDGHVNESRDERPLLFKNRANTVFDEGGARPLIFRKEISSNDSLSKDELPGRGNNLRSGRSNTTFDARPTIHKTPPNPPKKIVFGSEDLRLSRPVGWNKATKTIDPNRRETVTDQPTDLFIFRKATVVDQPEVFVRRGTLVNNPPAQVVRRGTVEERPPLFSKNKITNDNDNKNEIPRIFKDDIIPIDSKRHMLDGLDLNNEKDRYHDLGSKSDKKLQSLKRSFSFCVRNTIKIQPKKRRRYNSCPALNSLKKYSNVLHTTTTSPTTSSTTPISTTPKKPRKSFLRHQEQQILVDRQRAFTVQREQHGFGLLPSKSTTALMNFARNPEIKAVQELINIPKSAAKIERDNYEIAEASHKRINELYDSFRTKNHTFPDIRNVSRVYIREAHIHVSPGDVKKKYHLVLFNDLLVMSEVVKPFSGLGVQIRINGWQVKTLPDEKVPSGMEYPGALVSQKLKKIFRIYFETCETRSLWITDILNALKGGFDHLSWDKFQGSQMQTKKSSANLNQSPAIDEKKLFTNFMVAGVIGAIKDIPQDMFVVFLLTGEKKTVPCHPNHCIRHTIEKICRHFNLDPEDCSVFSESGEEISLETKFGEMETRAVVLATKTLLKTMYTSFSFQRKGEIAKKESQGKISASTSAVTPPSRPLKSSTSAPDIMPRSIRFNSTSHSSNQEPKSDTSSSPRPIQPPPIKLPNNSSPSISTSPPVTHFAQAVTQPHHVSPVSAVSNKRTMRSISLGVNRTMKADANNNNANDNLLAPDTVAARSLSFGATAAVTPLSLNPSKNSFRDNPNIDSPRSLFLTQTLSNDKQAYDPLPVENNGNEDESEFSEMEHSYAQANIDLSLIYGETQMISKQVAQQSEEINEKDNFDFFETSFTEECLGITTWREDQEMTVKIKPKFEEEEPQSQTQKPVRSTSFSNLIEPESKMKWRSSAKKKLKSKKSLAESDGKIKDKAQIKGSKDKSKPIVKDNFNLVILEYDSTQVHGVVGALNEIPANLFVVIFPNGTRKTIPLFPQQSIREALWSRCERMNPSIILEDCLVKDTNHKLLTMDTLIGDIDARFLLVEKKKM